MLGGVIRSHMATQTLRSGDGGGGLRDQILVDITCGIPSHISSLALREVKRCVIRYWPQPVVLQGVLQRICGETGGWERWGKWRAKSADDHPRNAQPR